MARLAVAMGDPSGIGPEVLAQALPGWSASEVLLIGDAAVWRRAGETVGVTAAVRPARRPEPISPEGIPFLDLPTEERWEVGRMSPAAGGAAARWLEQAVRLALDGAADAVVFAPLNKEAIIRAGYRIRDEYDLCASLAGVTDYDEVNVIPHPGGGDLLWVARVTAHVPFREIPSLITTERVLRTIRLAHRISAGAGKAAAGGLDDTRGKVIPRIGVAALNPHTGEGGMLGDEEGRVIAPAVTAAAKEGIAVSGPYPADHIFRLARAGHLDVVVVMYHDQAQIATKLIGFERGVSVGVGYPFVLTTPSHGTALDIAGKGIADPGPMRQALTVAERLVAQRLQSDSV
ncbi:MAG: 4-hydroxythreonine-4-phosphate dehydrogenase PdxA [Armatimonadetes bacterium]|nr:4-hydroxythreonine-4-phosphate dehydrogenase PdxA [Armatimonadota bacterium]